MGLLENMDNETSCTEAIFQAYITSKSKKEIFLFFEGKDDFKYYSSRVSPYIYNREYGVYKCQCKKNVVEVQKMISNQSAIVDNIKNLFFIDCDYDNNEDIPQGIYITSSYSIENYYFTDSAIKKILIGVIGLSEENIDDNTDLSNVSDYIKRCRDEIIEEIIYANAWYSLQIKRSKKSNKSPRMAPIKGYGAIKNIKEASKLESMVEDSIKLSRSEIEREIDEIRKAPVDRIRGKYLVEALTPILRKVFIDSGKKKGNTLFKKRRKVKTNLHDIINELSGYADTPPSLITYIEEQLSIEEGK